MVGKSVSHYEILDKLGEGGMGVVYRARDTKLGRDVALKLLPEQFARDPQRMGRFEREARVLASLNHPHIASIYGLEQQNGVHALVMELVEGPTLADRIDEGAIPLEEALTLARQITDALEYAHERGIVHRDLKPANVKVTEDGTVKVLDFGLAKAMTDESAVSDPENSPTLTIGATKAGVILGTAAYMSPEQARGKRVDKRADIWSFGVVLYEMLTGKRLFGGEDLTETLASVVKEHPDLNAAPPKMRRLLARCLEKDPKKRLRDIGDAWELLEEERPPESGRPEKTRFGRLPWVVAALLLVTTTVFVALWLRSGPPPVQVTRFELAPPEGTRLASRTPQISPDGRMIAFAASGEEAGAGIYVRSLDTLEARLLEGTAESDMFWSADSRSLAFIDDGKLKRVDLAGGSPRVLAEATSRRQGAWNRDNVILFRPNPVSALWRITAAGDGEAAPVTELDEEHGEYAHGYPDFLPDGKRFLFVRFNTDSDKSEVALGSLDGGLVTTVFVHNGMAKLVRVPGPGRFAGDYLLYQEDTTLFARRFDLAAGRLEGDAVVVAENVQSIGSTWDGTLFSVSDSGTLVFTKAGAARGNPPLVWFDRGGTRLDPPSGNPVGFLPRLSPDGRQVAVVRSDPAAGTTDIWTTDLDRGVSTRVTFDPGIDRDPLWTGDGERLLYVARTGNVGTVVEKAASGAGEERQLRSGGELYDLSPDGGSLLIDEQSELDLAPVAVEGAPAALTPESLSVDQARFSPDGLYIAYSSLESDRHEIYVRAVPPATGKWQVSTEGGQMPAWRGDGRELFFVSADDRMMSVEVSSSAPFQAGVPRPLFDSVGFAYDVTADGQRFLISESPESAQDAGSLVVVENWYAELQDRQ